MQPSTAPDDCAARHVELSSASYPPAVRQYPWLAVSRSPTQGPRRRGAWSIPGDGNPSSNHRHEAIRACCGYLHLRSAGGPRHASPMTRRFVVAQVCAPALIPPTVSGRGCSGTKHGERPTWLTASPLRSPPPTAQGPRHRRDRRRDIEGFSLARRRLQPVRPPDPSPEATPLTTL